MKSTQIVFRSTLLFVYCFLVFNVSGQIIYLSSIENNLYTLDVETCEINLISNVDKTILDISFHPNGMLYGISGDGKLYEINPNNGHTNICLLYTSPSPRD